MEQETVTVGPRATLRSLKIFLPRFPLVLSREWIMPDLRVEQLHLRGFV